MVPEDDRPTDDAAMMNRLTRLAVVVQMENLRTHPSVQRAVASGVLQIHGWVYENSTIAMKAYDCETGMFRGFPG
jgi:carbonic anhydrase